MNQSIALLFYQFQIKFFHFGILKSLFLPYKVLIFLSYFILNFENYFIIFSKNFLDFPTFIYKFLVLLKIQNICLSIVIGWLYLSHCLLFSPLRFLISIYSYSPDFITLLHLTHLF